MNLHRLAEERSLAYHRAVARRLASNPLLVKEARARVRAALSAPGRSAPYWRRWNSILSGSLKDLSAALADRSEDARALRQCSPFAGALAPRERWRIWRRTRARFERRA